MIKVRARGLERSKASSLKNDNCRSIMEELITAKDVARLLKVNRNTIYVWVSRCEIPCEKLPGNTTRFRPSALDAWLKTRSSKGRGIGRGVYLDIDNAG